MSTSGVPTASSAHNVAAILTKLNDADPDIRFMTLTDLNSMLEHGHQTFLSHDYTTSAKVVDGLLGTLNDTNGDVQNVAIKTLGNFTHKAPEAILSPMIEKVSNIKTTNSIDTTVAALAVRAIVVNLAHPVVGIPRTQKVQDSYTAVSKALIPRLIGKVVIAVPGTKMGPPKGMLQEDLETGSDSNSLDLLTEVARSFGPMLQPVEVEALEQVTMEVLENERCGTVMKKKAVAALSALAPYFSDMLLGSFVSSTIERLRSPHLTSPQRKLYLTAYGSLAKSIPQSFGPYLKTLTPFVLSPLSQQELEQQREDAAEADGEQDMQLEEVREAALVAIEHFLQACADDMKAYTKDVLDATTRFLKYEPNVADDDDEEMQEDAEDDDDEFEADEDFEEETGFEDEDDVSWKVRRCSAKALHALIQTLDANDPAIYGQIAPALISRFKEREESVRTEIISTLAFLVAKTGSTYEHRQVLPHKPVLPASRKRRRGLSDSFGSDLRVKQASMNDYGTSGTPPPVDTAAQRLTQINPQIVEGAAKLLKTSTIPTRQAVITMLKDMVMAQHGGLSDHAGLVIDPVIDTMNSVTGSVSNAAGNSLRIEGLHFIKVIAEMHSTKVIQPHLSKIIPTVVKSAKERFAKVAVEAFAMIDVFVRALTPPRAIASGSENAEHLAQLYQITVDRVTAADSDTEVRQKAVQVLGSLIGRTAGPADSLLKQKNRFEGQQLIADRLKNELTRLASVQAVDTIVVLATSTSDFAPGFIPIVTLELGGQLRKASRSLRGASLSALRMLVLNQASRECLDEATVVQIVDLLVPLLKAEDLHMMSPALIVLAALAKEHPTLVTTDAVVAGVCTIVQSSLSGAALDALLTCVETMGQTGNGQPLMQQLLGQGVHGDADVSGQVIGTLLVSGGPKIGVTLDNFFHELRTQQDEARKCLALSVLGEAGLRLGAGSPLTPESFMPYFAESSEKVKLAAAVALGRAGAGNVKLYLPKVLDAMSQGKQYLLLHSVKELLQHSSAEDDIRPYTASLWDNVVSSGQTEDNKVVGAECIGRLAIIDPTTYLPQLRAFLQNPNPIIRGMVMTALRYVFSDTEDSYDTNLTSNIIPMLSTMLGDSDLDNQRLSLSTLNSALQNKPDLVLPHLTEVLPYAMAATAIRPELIREVQMGPFKHKVDDGLELRKSAYETLYALLDSSASRQKLDVSAFYDRIVAGIADEHEIKLLCCLVLSKLISLAPDECKRRLDSLAASFRVVLGFKPKENAVKQELEKVSEANKVVVRTTLLFNKVLAADESRAWKEYVEYVRKDFAPLYKAAEDEVKEGRDR
nr:cullin-associated nedd8-dissociated protein 1, c-terminal part [Quercus suber]